MEKIYIVKYKGGEYSESFENTIFSTRRECCAKSYADRFNNILEKLKKHCYERSCDNLHRYLLVDMIDLCFYEEVELR